MWKVGWEAGPNSEGCGRVVGLGSALSGGQAWPKMHLLSLPLAACCHLKLFSLSSCECQRKAGRSASSPIIPPSFCIFTYGKKPVVMGDMKNWASCFAFLCPHASFRRHPQDVHSVLGTAAALSLSFQAVLVLGMKSVWLLTILLML